MLLVLLGACAPKQEPPPPSSEEAASSEEPVEESASEDEGFAPTFESPADDDEPLPDETAPIAYENQVAFGGDVFFNVRAYGQGNRKLLVVQAMRDGKVVDGPASASFNGDVISAAATDLDGDESGEVLVFGRVRSERRPGVFAGFAFVGERFTPLSFPELDRGQAKGYRGGDAFRVDGRQLLRTFPVFEGTGDQPTARTRTIRYALDGFELTVQETEG